MRLRTKLLVPFLALPLASIAVLGLVAYRGGRQAIEDSLGQLFEAEAARGIDALDRDALALYHETESWAALEAMQDVLTGDMDGRMSSFLVGRARAQPALRRAVVADASGQAVAASHADSLGSLVSQARRRAAAGKDACLDDPGPRAASTVTCAFPISAPFDERRLLGTLVAEWDLGQVFERLGREEPLVKGRAGFALLRRDGLVVAASPGIRPMAPPGSPLFSGPAAEVLAGSLRRGFRVVAIEGEPYLVGFARSAGLTGWSLVVIEKATVAFAPAYRLGNIVLLIAVGVGLLAFLLSILGSARLTRPLRELDAAARRVAEGDLTVRLEPRFGDEIDSLSRSFGTMIGNLARQRAQLVDKEYVDSLIAGMSDGLLVVDGAGRVERANAALARVLGRPADSLLGRPAGELFAEGEEEFAARVLELARRRGTANEVELGLSAAGGEVVPVIVSAGLLPARGPSEPAGVVCITTEITRRKAGEAHLVRMRAAAEAAAVAKARFLAAVSHEVRTPLNGILGMTDLLAGTALNDKQREYVDTARRSSEALLSVISDILDYSRMDAGKLTLARVGLRPPSVRARRRRHPGLGGSGAGPRALGVRRRPHRAPRRGRSPPPSPGAAQPREQRGQVHRVGRRRPPGRAGGRRDGDLLGERHGHRRAGFRAREDLRALPAGRRFDHPAARGSGAGPGHRPADRGDDGRDDRGGRTTRGAARRSPSRSSCRPSSRTAPRRSSAPRRSRA